MNSALKASNCLLATACARCAAGLNVLHISKRSKAEVAEFAKIAVTLANGWRAGSILTKWEGSGAVKWLRVIYLLRWDKPFDGMDNQDVLISFDRQIWRILLTRLYLKPNNCKSSLGVWWGNIISGLLYLQCLHLFGFQIIVWYPWNLRGLSEQFLMPMSKRSVNMESSIWFFEEPFFSKPPTLDYHLHANWMDPPEEKNRFVRPWWPVSNMMTYLKLWDYSATPQGFLR